MRNSGFSFLRNFFNGKYDRMNINKYFNHSEKLRHLLGLMTKKTILYVKTFDEIMADLLTSTYDTVRR